MRDQYAVFGNPVDHSRSPMIHAAFAQQTQQALDYRSECVAMSDFSRCVTHFFSVGGRGANVTVPFKLDAWDYADQLTSRAKAAGAVNTLSCLEDGTIRGDNTDGVGLVTDLLDNLRWPIRDRRVLMLGAGGAVRCVLAALMAQQPKCLTIANRTVEKAAALAARFPQHAEVIGCDYNALETQQFDLVINGTSVSLAGGMLSLPSSLLASQDGCCYDMMYAAQPTGFMRWGQQCGAEISDGLGMLVEQAAESFFVWRNARPETSAVIKHVRAAL